MNATTNPAYTLSTLFPAGWTVARGQYDTWEDLALAVSYKPADARIRVMVDGVPVWEGQADALPEAQPG